MGPCLCYGTETQQALHWSCTQDYRQLSRNQRVSADGPRRIGVTSGYAARMS